MVKGGSVYILTNKNNKVLYTGVSSDLVSRTIEHKEGKYPNSFSSRYKTTKLVYYENYHHIEEAIAREKQIKAGSRKAKLKLINSMNPTWRDLFDDIKDW